MNNMEFKPNSHKSKEEQAGQEVVPAKKFDKVVTGNVKTKKNGAKNLAGKIVAGDPSEIKSFMVEDVVIPSIKNLIEDLVVKGCRMLLRGKTGARNNNTNAGFVEYNKMSDGRPRRPDPVQRSVRTYQDITLESRADAEEVLYRLKEALATYGMVSVADLYDLLGQSHAYTDQKYGWTNLDSARIESVRGGYVFDLPRAIPLT